jgi:branched-chain amino acid transport system ATP-binding protein
LIILEIIGLTKNFGGLTAVSNVDIKVNDKEVLGLIGPNGAGKTTVFNLLTGVIRPTKGKVVFKGKDITGKKPHEIAELGVGRTFQLNPLFPNFTVLENVLYSFQLRPCSSLLDTFFNSPTYRNNEAYIMEQSLEILNLVGLYKVKDELAKNQPHGYQKMLGVARALAIKPELLLLDEPIAGMNPDEIDNTIAAIKRTSQLGVTIILVEHNMKILEICDRVVVINFGQKIVEGSPQEIKENPEVIKAYFGSGHDTKH